jgi:hypothetical protein
MAESERCSATSKKGDKCKNRTLRDGLCWVHAIKDKKLQVKDSGIPGAGKGLFAVSKMPTAKGGEGSEVVFKPGDVIDTYRGTTMTQEEVDRHYGQDEVAPYVIYSKNQDKYIDATDPTSCFARFANAAAGSGRRPNAHFEEGARIFPKLVATRRIREGQEVLAQYGEGRDLGYDVFDPRPERRRRGRPRRRE